MSQTTNLKRPLVRLLRGTELADGLVFINYRVDSKTVVDGRVSVRLFDADKIVTRRWFKNAHIEIAERN